MPITITEDLPASTIAKRRDSTLKRRDDAEAALATQIKLRKVARGDLEDLEDRRVRRGENIGPQIAKAEARLHELEREVRAHTTARDRTFAETEPELRALTEALAVAERREEQAADEAELAARRAKTLGDVEQFMRGLAQALVALEAMRVDAIGFEPHMLAGVFDRRGLEIAAANIFPKIDGVTIERSGRVPWGFVATVTDSGMSR